MTKVQMTSRTKAPDKGLDRGQTTIYGDDILINKVVSTYEFKNLHEIRYDVRGLTNRGFRNRVI
jgi:hypothetical protein